jgi:hypothetical protein
VNLICDHREPHANDDLTSSPLIIHGCRYNFAFPRVVTLGQIPNTTFHRNTDHFPAAEPTPGILEFRVDAPLFYGNVVDIQVGLPLRGHTSLCHLSTQWCFWISKVGSTGRFATCYSSLGVQSSLLLVVLTACLPVPFVIAPCTTTAQPLNSCMLSVRFVSILYLTLQDKFERAVKEHSAWSAQVTGGAVPKTRFVVWDLTPITYADSMGLHLLEDTVFFCIKHGITLYVSNPGKQLVRDW